jgi:hypothetical protein
MKSLDKLQKIEDMINACVERIWNAKEYLSKKEALVYHYFEGNVRRHLNDCERALPRLQAYFNKELENLKYIPKIAPELELDKALMAEQKKKNEERWEQKKLRQKTGELIEVFINQHPEEKSKYDIEELANKIESE